jgi:hypothetical protein
VIAPDSGEPAGRSAEPATRGPGWGPRTWGRAPRRAAARGAMGADGWSAPPGKSSRTRCAGYSVSGRSSSRVARCGRGGRAGRSGWFWVDPLQEAVPRHRCPFLHADGVSCRVRAGRCPAAGGLTPRRRTPRRGLPRVLRGPWVLRSRPGWFGSAPPTPGGGTRRDLERRWVARVCIPIVPATARGRTNHCENAPACQYTPVHGESGRPPGPRRPPVTCSILPVGRHHPMSIEGFSTGNGVLRELSIRQGNCTVGFLKSKLNDFITLP